MKETLDIGGRTFEVDGPLTLSLKAQVIQTLQGRINRVSPATCPGNVVQNSNHQIIFNITGGVPPYTYTVLVDGLTKAGPVSTSSTTWSVPVTFSEAIGTHTVLGRMVDSCGTPQTATDQCTINITAPVTTGSISCTTTPAAGASILIDSVLQSGALTPITLTNVSAGSHMITFRLAGYNDCQLSVNVTAGATATATCTLIPVVTMGSIQCTTTPPGAAILVDGIYQSGALTPITLTNISTGSHTATFRLSGYNDCSSTVSVTAGSTATASCTLTPVAVTICTWISSGGGVSSVTIPKIFNLVDSYIGIINLGFTPTNQQIFGSVDYYLGFIASGNSKTGCSF